MRRSPISCSVILLARLLTTQPGKPDHTAIRRTISPFRHNMSKNSASHTETVNGPPANTSGVSRIRTDDPLLAKQVLYQLSYNPLISGAGRS